MQKKNGFTVQDDKVILKNIGKYSSKQEAFRQSAKTLGRTPEAVSTRYYAKLNGKSPVKTEHSGATKEIAAPLITNGVTKFIGKVTHEEVVFEGEFQF